MQASPQPADEAQSLDAIEPAQSAPLISGEPVYLWTGAGAFLLIVILSLVLIGRWRAGRRARDAARNTEYFQPAGEGAEITFDEVAPTPDGPPFGEDAEPAMTEVFPDPHVRRKRSPFSNLFAKRDKAAPHEAEPPLEVIDLDDTEEGLASVRIERPVQPPRSGVFADGHLDNFDDIARETDRAANEREELSRGAEERHRAEEDAARRLAAEAEAGRRRMQEADDARRRLAEDDRHRATALSPRAVEPDRGAAHDDIVRTLSEVEEALHAQREAIQAETRTLLDSFARRFSDRLDALAHSVDRRSSARSSDSPESAPAKSEELTAIADMIGRRLDEHRDQVAGSVNALSKRLDADGGASRDMTALREEIAQLRRSLVGRADLSSPVVQLADIVRDALPPNAYEFNALLANNRRADCLVRLPHPPGPIAIDARFPVEAFHALREGRGDGDNEFRRAALRHIVDIAERLIAPGTTAESALMFIPSESMYAEFHARFPEVVQDSYRARVWIVSPTTLMATLHTISAVMRDAAPADSAFSAENDANRVLAEVERLRERVAALEMSFGRSRPTPREAVRDIAGERAPAPAESEWRAEMDIDAAPAPALQPGGSRRLPQPAADNDSGHPDGDLYADDHDVGSFAEHRPYENEPRRTTPARPPFPLR